MTGWVCFCFSLIFIGWALRSLKGLRKSWSSWGKSDEQLLKSSIYGRYIIILWYIHGEREYFPCLVWTVTAHSHIPKDEWRNSFVESYRLFRNHHLLCGSGERTLSLTKRLCQPFGLLESTTAQVSSVPTNAALESASFFGFGRSTCLPDDSGSSACFWHVEDVIAVMPLLCPLSLALLESSWLGKWSWGLVTAVIGDVAAIFGCCLGIKVHSKGTWNLDSKHRAEIEVCLQLADQWTGWPLRQAMGTAITFVALGVDGWFWIPWGPTCPVR